MTRINCVPAAELHTKHLVAEYRELPRVFAQAAAAHARGEKPDDKRNPRHYVLGTGHVRFFYDKLGYLDSRFDELVAEMVKRGYKPNFLSAPASRLPSEWLKQWAPSVVDLTINRKRIADRTPK
jgi:deoxyribonuclease (pyrimidine dimer)